MTTAPVSVIEEMLELPHLDCTLIFPIWLVYVYVLGRACRDLAGTFVERDGFELELLIDVDGLENVVRSVEDNKRIPRDVCLTVLRISRACVLHCVCGRRTIIWFPSHRP